MFDPSDIHRPSPPRVPTWLARDLGIDPSTRLATVSGSSIRRGITRLVRSAWGSAGDEVMAAIPLFEGLSKQQRRLASQLATTVVVPAGAVLTQEGASGGESFVVLEGHVDVIRDGHVIATRGPGSPLGEMALLHAEPRTATLIAKSPVSTLVSGRQEFNSLLAAIPQISERLHTIAAERRAA